MTAQGVLNIVGIIGIVFISNYYSYQNGHSHARVNEMYLQYLDVNGSSIAVKSIDGQTLTCQMNPSLRRNVSYPVVCVGADCLDDEWNANHPDKKPRTFRETEDEWFAEHNPDMVKDKNGMWHSILHYPSNCSYWLGGGKCWFP